MMKLQKAPLATSGLILGLLGLGNLLKDISLILNAICGILAILIWLHLLYSMFHNFNHVKDQLNNPLVASVFTTFFMSGFLVTTYLNTFYSRECLSIMDCPLYWYCNCWIDCTSERLLYHW